MRKTFIEMKVIKKCLDLITTDLEIHWAATSQDYSLTLMRLSGRKAVSAYRLDQYPTTLKVVDLRMKGDKRLVGWGWGSWDWCVCCGEVWLVGRWGVFDYVLVSSDVGEGSAGVVCGATHPGKQKIRSALLFLPKVATDIFSPSKTMHVCCW